MKKFSIKNEVKEILKAAKKAGISARRLAIESGSDIETIRRWKVGKNKPGYEKYEKFKQAFLDLTKTN